MLNAFMEGSNAHGTTSYLFWEKVLGPARTVTSDINMQDEPNSSCGTDCTRQMAAHTEQNVLCNAEERLKLHGVSNTSAGEKAEPTSPSDLGSAADVDQDADVSAPRSDSSATGKICFSLALVVLFVSYMRTRR